MTGPHTHLEQIAAALPHLHDDAFNPIRAIATQPVELNEFTRPHWQPERGTHPHLRRPTGARPATIPTGDRAALNLYRHTARIILDAYTALVPPAARQRPRGGRDGDPPPLELVGMLTQLHRTIDQWDCQGQRAQDLRPVLHDHLHHLERLADTLTRWTTTWTPPAGHETCPNPRGRHRCTGHAEVGELCRSCYNHENYRERRAS